MGALNHKIAIGFLFGLMMLSPAHQALAGGADAKKHGAETITAAEKMVDHGGQGHMKTMTKHANEMIMHANGTIKALPAGDKHGDEVKTHFQEAIKEAEKAIDHGGQGHGDVAMKHANASLMHAQEGAKHLGAVK